MNYLSKKNPEESIKILDNIAKDIIKEYESSDIYITELKSHKEVENFFFPDFALAALGVIRQDFAEKNNIDKL